MANPAKAAAKAPDRLKQPRKEQGNMIAPKTES